ncbi:helix-turn-helix domain-containing protein [Spirillospora sp. NPDC048911]|uniref:helix-turn-helix domain-containing protein n=1 Tax=Spirillospora sp. NPDC048911 TaxID=3364527 RepID=UPI0037242AA8
MSEDSLARRIAWEMDVRGWSQERLAKEMTDAGHPFHQSSISKIVKPKDGKRRSISVDDALGFAKVFEVPLDELLIPLEAVWDTQLRDGLTRLAALHHQREAIDREAAGLVTQVVKLAQAAGEQHFDRHLDAASAAERRRFLDEMHRWGQRLMSQVNAGVLEGVTDEEALDRLRRITFGERLDRGDRA